MTGFSVSFTVIVNVQVEVPQSLVAVAVTVVVPIGKKLPEACEYVMNGDVPVEVAAGYVTFAPHRPVVLPTLILDGQVIKGDFKITSTVKLQEDAKQPLEDVTVTVVIPALKSRTTSCSAAETCCSSAEHIRKRYGAR